MTKLRVAMLPLQPSSSAATRAHCIRQAAALRELGFGVTVMLPPAARLHDRLRSFGRLRVPVSLLYWYAIAAPVRLIQIACASGYDVVFIQRGLLRVRSAPILEMLLYAVTRMRGHAVVYHSDDALHTVASASARARYRFATVVATGSKEVAAAARDAGADVAEIEAGLDVERYPVRHHERRDPVVIGWVGTNASDHLLPLVDTVRRLGGTDAVVLRVISARPFAAPGLEGLLEWRPWLPELEYSVFADLDIGIMPLEDTPYNRGKEAYKLKEYMAAGLPVVCSPVGENLAVVEDGVTGFFAVAAPDWENRLRALVRDHDLRRRMGAAGRVRALELYHTRAQARKLASLFWATTRHASRPGAVAS